MPHRDFTDMDYQDHYREQYGVTGRDFGYYRPAYRYGYDLGHETRYRGRDWNAIEGDIRRDWEMRHPDTIWEDIKDAVRRGWENIKDTFD